MLVVSSDAHFGNRIADCCCTLSMSVRTVRDIAHAADALALGEAELAIVDGDLGIERIVEFARQVRLSLCVDWAPIIVAGQPERLRPSLHETIPGMVDHVIAKPLVHEELRERLVAARRAVSLKRAYDSTLDRVSEAVVVIDESGRIHGANAAAQRLFQWQDSELRGASINRLLPQRLRDEHDGYIARYQATGRANVIGKGRIESGQRRDGSLFPMHLTVSDISDSQGVRFVGVIRDLTRDREADVLRQRAESDELTGLPNHAHARQRLRECCARAGDGGEGFALIYLDLDRFKPVNDTHGHAVGDEVLKAVGRRLRHALEEHDIVARLGGDEFVALLHGVSRRAQADAVVQRLQASIERPLVVGGIVIHVGVSAGVALHGLDGRTPHDLLQAADQAMYANKRRRVRSGADETREAQRR
jgi:diguanylate cyclase (GGDEF)-like protein/PAS domain S-box-containing protein